MVVVAPGDNMMRNMMPLRPRVGQTIFEGSESERRLSEHFETHSIRLSLQGTLKSHPLLPGRTSPRRAAYNKQDAEPPPPLTCSSMKTANWATLSSRRIHLRPGSVLQSCAQ
jgi:hypothetical protein